MRPTVLVTLILASLAAAPAAEARTYDVRAALGAQLGRVAARTSVPVRVPASLSLDFDGRVYASGSASRRRWSLGLAGVRDCGGANACFLADMSGERGGRLSLQRRVRLARGITGGYKPTSCGASCSPAMIEWLQGGVLFSIQAKVGPRAESDRRAALVRAANSAIRARPR